VDTQYYYGEPAPGSCPLTRRRRAGSAAAATPNFPLYQAFFTPNPVEDAQATNPQYAFTTNTTTQQTNRPRGYPPVQLPTNLRVQQTTTPSMTTPATAKTLPLFYGDYSDKEEPAHWFAQFQLALPESWPETAKVQRFHMQLAPGGYADKWFDALTASERASVAAIRTVFLRRWPPTKRAKWSKVQQKERIRDQGLKEEEIGKWIQEGRVGDYGQNVWAERVMKLALSMGDAGGMLIEYAIETTPTILRDHLEEGYDSWEEFIQAVWSIPAAKLRHSKEDLEKERTRDSAIAALRQQVAQLTVQASASNYQTLPRVSPTSLPYANTVTGATTPITSQGTAMPAGVPFSSAQQWRNPSPYRGPPLLRAPLSRAQIVERISSTPQRPNTEEGKRLWRADVEAWHRTHGSDATPSLERPYLLKPGMAVLGSGECFVCGMVTDPPHIGGTCQAAEPLKPLESHWRQLVAGMLRQAMSPRPLVSQVQHVWPMMQPHLTTSMLAPVPIHAVGAYEEDTGTRDNYGFEGDGYMETPWDWVTASENGGGLRQPADQQ